MSDLGGPSYPTHQKDGDPNSWAVLHKQAEKRREAAEKQRQNTGARYQGGLSEADQGPKVRIKVDPAKAAAWNKQAFPNTDTHAALRDGADSQPAPRNPSPHALAGETLDQTNARMDKAIKQGRDQEEAEGQAYRSREVALAVAGGVTVGELLTGAPVSIGYCDNVQKYAASDPNHPAVKKAVHALREQFGVALKAVHAMQRAIRLLATDVQEHGKHEFSAFIDVFKDMSEAVRLFEQADAQARQNGFSQARSDLYLGNSALSSADRQIEAMNADDIRNADFAVKILEGVRDGCTMTLTLLGGMGGALGSLAAGLLKIAVKGAGAASSHFQGIDTDVTPASLGVEAIMEIVSFFRPHFIDMLIAREPFKTPVEWALKRVPAERAQAVIRQIGLNLWDVIKGTINKKGEMIGKRETGEKRASAFGWDVFWESVRDHNVEFGGEKNIMKWLEETLEHDMAAALRQKV